MPLLNPDGYEFSRTDDRMWRKNRAPPPEHKKSNGCRGVDLNRNWNVTGYGVGASENPCEDTYGGEQPGSQPEVQAAARNLMARRDRIRISISVHSYGECFELKSYLSNILIQS